MSSPQSYGPCRETSGFLFKHPCSSPGTLTCSQCAKTICATHSREGDTGTLCITCAKQWIQRDSKGYQQRHSHDPYYYSHSHYGGLGYYNATYWGYHSYHHRSHHSDDFTDADGSALGSEGDEGFENDLSAS